MKKDYKVAEMKKKPKWKGALSVSESGLVWQIVRQFSVFTAKYLQFYPQCLILFLQVGCTQQHLVLFQSSLLSTLFGGHIVFRSTCPVLVVFLTVGYGLLSRFFVHRLRSEILVREVTKRRIEVHLGARSVERKQELVSNSLLNLHFYNDWLLTLLPERYPTH